MGVPVRSYGLSTRLGGVRSSDAEGQGIRLKGRWHRRRYNHIDHASSGSSVGVHSAGRWQPSATWMMAAKRRSLVMMRCLKQSLAGTSEPDTHGRTVTARRMGQASRCRQLKSLRTLGRGNHAAISARVHGWKSLDARLQVASEAVRFQPRRVRIAIPPIGCRQ